MPGRRRQPSLRAARPALSLRARLAPSTGCPLAKTVDDETQAAREAAEIRSIASGDQSAFARLIDRESPRLLRFARTILGTLEEAEDVVQETLISLWENAERWRPEARVGTWLHTVCYNRCIDRLRRRRRFVDDSALDQIADESAQPDGGVLQSETVRSVRAALEQLPHRQRSAVLLFHFQDMPQKEAARAMGVSERAFELLLARARRQMRLWLSAAGGDHE